MPSVFLFVFLTSLTTHVAFGNSCGGLLEGESGHFSLPLAPDREEAETSNSSCLWIIQLHYKANIRFTLNDLDPNSYLNLYPEDQLTACTASNTTKLNATHVGSSLEFSGKTLIVILPKASKFVAFSWAVNNGSETMKNSDYVSSAQGLLEWQQLESEERVTWAINPGPPVSIKWNLDILTSCNASDNCACVYFAIFQLTSEGILSEAMRTCGQSSEGTLEEISGTVVTLIKAKTSVKANKIAVSWGVEAVVPPVPTGGLFAATAKGLVSLNLRNLQATPLTNEHTGAVAVNHNLKKVYWSEIYENSRIMRSNFDGSAKEVIVPPTGARIYMLAIDKNTGNIYFGVQLSYEITVCSSLGENCTVIISSSLLGDWPYGLALDVDYGGMYWGKQPALVRANLDGSNATIISTEFQELRGLTLKQPLNDAIYWVDFLANTIGTIDVNGGNKRILLELAGNPGPSGIQVDAQKIYFGNFYSRNIQSVNKDTGEELTTIFNSTGGVYNLALFNENPQKKALTFSG